MAFSGKAWKRKGAVAARVLQRSRTERKLVMRGQRLKM
jgi:hypothetical protein